MVHVVKALAALSRLDPEPSCTAALDQLRIAADRAQAALTSPADRQRLEAVLAESAATRAVDHVA